MKVVEPITIYNTIIIDYGATTSPDASLPEWDLLKADYAFGVEVKVAADKKKYKLAAQTVAAGTVPKDNTTIWIPSPLAELAMFEYDDDYTTVLNGNFKATIPNAHMIDTLYFQNIEGDTITITLLDDSDVVLETLTEDIYDWQIDTFSKYLFPDDPVRKSKIQFDFIDLRMTKIQIEIQGTITMCTYAIAGYKEDVGMTLREGIGFTQDNFYTNTRNEWGNLLSTNLRVVEDVSLPVTDYNANVTKNVNKISRLFAKPNLWIADDRDKENAEFIFLNIFGILITSSITPGGGMTDKILKIEGK